MDPKVMINSAISSGDSHKLKGLLRNGCNPDTILQESSGLTPLILATIKKSIPILKVLIEFRAFLNFKDKRGKTALMFACVYKDDNILSELVGAGADVNATDKGGRTALHYASQHGSLECIKYLMQLKNINLNQVDAKGKSAVHVAACEACDNGAECLQLLLNHGADIDKDDGHGDCPLAAAIHLRKVRNAQVLLRNGANTNVVNKKGKSPLTKAFEQSRNEEMLMLLGDILNAGAMPSLSVFDEQCLHEMIARGERKIVKQMIVNGCAPRLRTCKENVFHFDIIEKISPLAVALLTDQLGMAKYLLANSFLTSFDVNVLPNNPSILSCLAEKGFDQCLTLLNDISSTPFPQITLCLIAVADIFYSSHSTHKNYIKSQLPSPLVRKLLFKTDIASLCMHEWETIPLMMERGRIILNNRPLSLYWPIGHRLEECQFGCCLEGQGFRISNMQS